MLWRPTAPWKRERPRLLKPGPSDRRAAHERGGTPWPLSAPWALTGCFTSMRRGARPERWRCIRGTCLRELAGRETRAGRATRARRPPSPSRTACWASSSWYRRWALQRPGPARRVRTAFTVGATAIPAHLNLEHVLALRVVKAIGVARSLPIAASGQFGARVRRAKLRGLCILQIRVIMVRQLGAFLVYVNRSGGCVPTQPPVPLVPTVERARMEQAMRLVARVTLGSTLEPPPNPIAQTVWRESTLRQRAPPCARTALLESTLRRRLLLPIQLHRLHGGKVLPDSRRILPVRVHKLHSGHVLKCGRR